MAQEPNYGAPAPASDDHSAHLWNHVVDLHRKHSELALQMHDMHAQHAAAQPTEEHQRMLGEAFQAHQGQLQALEAGVRELTATLQQLIAIMKQDVKADRAVAASGRK